MHSSTIIVSALAALAVAGPLHQHAKRHLEMTTETLTHTVWITAGNLPSTTSTSTTEVESTSSSQLASEESTTTATVSITTTESLVPTPVETPAAAEFLERVRQDGQDQFDEETTSSTQSAEETTSADPEPTQQPDTPDSGSLSPPSSNTGDSEKDAWLNAHNSARAKHGAPPLVWDNAVEQHALEFASKCIWDHGFPAGVSEGQNLASMWGSDVSYEKPAPQESVNSWMSEETTFSANSCYGQANAEGKCWKDGGISMGHFTQVVWQETKSVGCATVNCSASDGKDGTTWMVFCNYSPPGNFGGEYAKNVLPPV